MNKQKENTSHYNVRLDRELNECYTLSFYNAWYKISANTSAEVQNKFLFEELYYNKYMSDCFFFIFFGNVTIGRYVLPKFCFATASLRSLHEQYTFLIKTAKYARFRNM